MNRIDQLETLKADLEKLVFFLRDDGATQWVEHFEHCLCEAGALLYNGFNQDQLNAFSVLVRQVYGGMGSFNDYVPNHEYEKYDNYSSRVYDSALALKVIGEY